MQFDKKSWQKSLIILIRFFEVNKKLRNPNILMTWVYSRKLSRNILCELNLQRKLIWKISFDLLEVRPIFYGTSPNLRGSEKKWIVENVLATHSFTPIIGYENRNSNRKRTLKSRILYQESWYNFMRALLPTPAAPCARYAVRMPPRYVTEEETLVFFAIGH